MLKAIVNFCYTGLIDLSEENVFNFLEISGLLEMDLLHAKCEQFACNRTTRSNALAHFIIADKHNYQDLRTKALNLIPESFEELPASEINGLDGRLLRAVLENNLKFHVKQELVFNRLAEWFRQDEVERGQHMVELLKLIRLGFMSTQFLMDEQLEAIFKRFNCFESILAERKTRETETMESSSDDRSRSRSIFYFCKDREWNVIHVERYDNASNAFEEAGTLYVGRKEYEIQLYENKVYVLGGRNQHGNLKSVTRFDLTSGREEVLPEMNEARISFTSILLGKYIYVFGGRGDGHGAIDTEESGAAYEMSCRFLNSCERFDLETMTWTVLKPMDGGRVVACARAVNGYIYLVGGQTDRSSSLPILELYDPKNDEWHRLAQVNACLPASLCTSNSFLYAIGRFGTMQKYDILNNRWTQLGSYGEMILTLVQTADGIFVITRDRGFGTIYLDANDILKFEPLALPRHVKNSTSTFWNANILLSN